MFNKNKVRAWKLSDPITRMLDVVLSGGAILVLLPFMLPIMAALKLTGEHYIFYEQERIGRGGKPFKMLKFATMLKDSPNLPGGLYTSENDPRMLPMGKFLRKTKINELPQLINIIKGDMSIIGYRPTVKDHFAAYKEEDRRQVENIRPGLSGIGSIVFRNEEEILQKVKDKEAFHQEVIQPYKGALEAWYARRRSVALYIELILMTSEAVLHPGSVKWWSRFKRKGIPVPPKKLRKYLRS